MGLFETQRAVEAVGVGSEFVGGQLDHAAAGGAALFNGPEAQDAAVGGAALVRAVGGGLEQGEVGAGGGVPTRWVGRGD